MTVASMHAAGTFDASQQISIDGKKHSYELDYALPEGSQAQGGRAT
jgi:hypothetical protein